MLIIKDEKGHSQIWAATTGNQLRSQRRIEKILRSLTAASHVLELGCGQGDLTLALLQSGHTVTALDRSQEMIDATLKRCKNHPNLRAVKCEIADYLKNESALYDAVVGMGILHHFAANLPELLALVANCLNHSGRGFFWEPNRENPLVQFIFGTVWGRQWMSLEPDENAFTKEQILDILNPLFAGVYVETRDWAYPFMPPALQRVLAFLESRAPQAIQTRIAQSLWIECYKSLDARTDSPK
jgi:SAM-dependent methyltransferase